MRYGHNHFGLAGLFGWRRGPSFRRLGARHQSIRAVQEARRKAARKIERDEGSSVGEGRRKSTRTEPV